ncbi:MAG TPA: ribonuclease P protein component [Candidatus Saccharimonadales bacterium]|nr:ribonuclease P protein component [Candidatus Saccharimonadales bacterium]
MIQSTHRFHGRSSLRFVYQKGASVRSDLPLALRTARNPRSRVWRVAVVVSRKVSKSAVVRNRIRRRIFEIVRRQGSHLDPGYDLVFSVYGPELAELDHAALETAITTQLTKAGVLR